jgi:hypothetical protein
LNTKKKKITTNLCQLSFLITWQKIFSTDDTSQGFVIQFPYNSWLPVYDEIHIVNSWYNEMYLYKYTILGTYKYLM